MTSHVLAYWPVAIPELMVMSYLTVTSARFRKSLAIAAFVALMIVSFFTAIVFVAVLYTAYKV